MNVYKILFTLLSGQPSKAIVILEYNMTNSLELPSYNNIKDISLRASNNSNQKIKYGSANTMGNNNRDIKPADINQ